MNYINAHATSTLVGDKAEVKAIKKVSRRARGCMARVTGLREVLQLLEGAPGVLPQGLDRCTAFTRHILFLFLVIMPLSIPFPFRCSPICRTSR